MASLPPTVMRTENSDWSKIALFVAATFHVLWGALSLLYPGLVPSLTGAAVPSPLLYWQLQGIYSLAMGVAYFCAASNPSRYWPVVLMGLLMNGMIPAGYVVSSTRGELPAAFGWVVLLHDGIWIAPFAWILWEAHELRLSRKRHLSPEIERIALRVRTTEAISLFEMTQRWPTLVIFLRHFGCMFCREALADLAARRRAIEATGTRLVLVHMATDAEAIALVAKYGLGDVARVADPGCAVYRAFGLAKGELGQIFGFSIWPRAFEAGIVKRHGAGLFVGDGFQMPGVFLMFHGEVLRAFRHQRISDRPDYVSLLEPAIAWGDAEKVADTA